MSGSGSSHGSEECSRRRVLRRRLHALEEEPQLSVAMEPPRLPREGHLAGEFRPLRKDQAAIVCEDRLRDDRFEWRAARRRGRVERGDQSRAQDR